LTFHLLHVQAYAAAGTSRILVDGTGFAELSGSFNYLGSIIHYSLTSDADVCKRVNQLVYSGVRSFEKPLW
jgi:hypothetical protein